MLQLAIEPSTALLKKNIGPHLLCPPLLIVQLAASILDALKGYLPASFALAQTAYFRGVEATVRGGIAASVPAPAHLRTFGGQCLGEEAAGRKADVQTGREVHTVVQAGLVFVWWSALQVGRDSHYC